MAGVPGRKGREWERARRQCLEGATVCQVPNCRYPGRPLDPTDTVNGRPGPLYPTADHLIPVHSTEGWSEADRRAALNDPLYLRPAHHGCNSSRYNNPGAHARPRRERHSRDWGV